MAVPGRFDLIVLSPHLDDAVFSCGGIIAAAASRGEAVQVVTFFCGDPDPTHIEPRLAKFCDYPTRKAEDLLATKALGAEHRWCDLVERAFRPPAIASLTGVFCTPKKISAFACLPDLEAEIAGFLADHPRAQILAPLAVGNHHDHVELALAALRVMWQWQACERFAFYEDAYALGTRARQLHPVTRGRLWQRSAAPQWTSLWAYGLFWLQGRAIKGPSLFDYLGEDRIGPLDFSCEPVALADEEKKLRAVGYYASQVAMLGGPRRWGAIMRRYHRFWQGAEPLWRARPRW